MAQFDIYFRKEVPPAERAATMARLARDYAQHTYIARTYVEGMRGREATRLEVERIGLDTIHRIAAGIIMRSVQGLPPQAPCDTCPACQLHAWEILEYFDDRQIPLKETP